MFLIISQPNFNIENLKFLNEENYIIDDTNLKDYMIYNKDDTNKIVDNNISNEDNISSKNINYINEKKVFQ